MPILRDHRQASLSGDIRGGSSKAPNREEKAPPKWGQEHWRKEGLWTSATRQFRARGLVPKRKAPPDDWAGLGCFPEPTPRPLARHLVSPPVGYRPTVGYALLSHCIGFYSAALSARQPCQKHQIR